MKMFKSILLISLLAAFTSTQAQNRVFTKNGKVTLDATAPSSPDKINGVNEKATSVMDIGTGALEFAVLMKAFNFEKALMQEHFNENYVESDKFPKAVFKGSVDDIKGLLTNKDGSYPVHVKGELTLHGVTKEIDAKGTISIKDGSVTGAKSNFNIKLSDFGIAIPSLVKDKILPEAKISVDLSYLPLKI